MSKTEKSPRKRNPSTRKTVKSGGATLAQTIAECLRFNIENGRLQGGTILLKAELARFFNVSRIPVAQAIEDLVHAGLLRKRDTQGYAVLGGETETKLETSHLDIPDHLVGRFDRQPSWERIYDQVETELLELMPYGRFQINESALTEYYAMNRGQTQQIITRLCERGIAEKLSQSQCNLLAYDEPFLRNRYELRALLEPFALEKASAHISKQEAQSALDYHKEVARHFPKTASEALPNLERTLHIDFIGRCTNPRILVALAGAQIPHATTTKMVLRVLGSNVEEPLLAEHIAILEPLAQGNSARAAAQLQKHLDSSCERSVRRLADFAALPKPALPPFLRAR